MQRLFPKKNVYSMKRSAYNQLLKWKESPYRKPLILEGARQVGKTWLIKEFGTHEYSNMVYINCADDDFAKNLFERDLKPERILRDIMAYTGKKIVAGKTLIVFDEIQDAPRGISSLKYFCEDAPDQHVIASGSLLGVVHHPDESYPVGKVDTIRLFPMSFIEFVRAKGNDILADELEQCDWGIISTLHDMLEDLLRQYYYVGGMPEAVQHWVTTGDMPQVRKIQEHIIASYANDISKHAGNEAERIRMVWNSIPAQLAKENKKFVYGAVRKGSRAKDFEVAIQWLVDAGLVYKVFRSKRPSVPLKFYEDFDTFKLYLLDVGLLGALSGTTAAQIIINKNIFHEYKGAFTENYVLQQIALCPNITINYYHKDNSTVEIDFLIQANGRLIPMEVKAEENVKSKSLRQFITIDYADQQLVGVRCSMLPFVNQGWMENVPLYGIQGYAMHFN